MKHLTTDKGHVSLESDERIQRFKKIMMSGWTKESYEKYRYDWENLSKLKVVRKYPPQLDVELSSACNLNCPMCYTITDEFKSRVNVKLMDFDLYRKIIDEVAEEIYALRLSWRGESTLHPRFVEAVEYAKSKGIKEVSFLTNGSKMDLDYFEKLVDAGIDWITISIDGLGSVYDSIRKPLRFDDILKKIKDINNFKCDNALVKPAIKIQTVWPAIKNNPEDYYNLFAPLVDMVAFNPIIDNLDVDRGVVYESGFSCAKFYQRIFVSADGCAYICNCDEKSKYPVGNALTQTIYDIWHGERLSSVRSLHDKVDGFMGLEICRECFYPRKTICNEIAVVNGRTINVCNYINRSQRIGE